MGDEEAAGRACRFCFDEGDEPLVEPCECSGSSAFVHHSCLLRWQSQQMLSVASTGRSPEVALSCLVCKTRYNTEPPAPGSLLEQVRGTGGAALAALLHPGTFLISRNRVLPDEDTLASAPLWLRWIIEHKHKQWIKSVYLITKVEARPGSENGDVLIGVNVTRARRSGADSDDDDDDEDPPPGTETSDDGDEEEEEEGGGDARSRPRRRLDMDSSSSPESDPSVPRPAPTAENAALMIQRVWRRKKEMEEEVQSVEPDDDLDPTSSLTRTYVGGPVQPRRRIVIHVSPSGTAALSPPTAHEVPLDRSGVQSTTGSSATRAFAYHQRPGDSEEYVDEIVGEAAAAALGEQGDDVDDPVPRVHVFMGHAKWSRTQLMNEVARGDWGVCPALPEDLEGGWKETGGGYWEKIRASGRPVFSSPGGD